MVSFLVRHGFDVLKLTERIILGNDKFIGRNHVILLSQLVSTTDGTWGVIFNGDYYHNFTAYTLDGLSLVNKPVMSAYLVCDRRYRVINEQPRLNHKLKGKFRLEMMSRMESSRGIKLKTL